MWFVELQRESDGAIVEMFIWRLNRSVPGSHHGLKYRLFHGFPGERVIGYDNEAGKGDHRRLRDAQTRYRFMTVEKLIADFLADIASERGET
ncbi:MAG: toxin-antitoxin system TumE family protein [Rhodanobacteraceae bacterium]